MNPIIYEIDSNKLITISKYPRKKGSTRIDIRQTYIDANGEQKYTQKGVSLSVEQYLKLKSLIPYIDQTLRQVEKK